MEGVFTTQFGQGRAPLPAYCNLLAGTAGFLPRIGWYRVRGKRYYTVRCCTERHQPDQIVLIDAPYRLQSRPAGYTLIVQQRAVPLLLFFCYIIDCMRPI